MGKGIKVTRRVLVLARRKEVLQKEYDVMNAEISEEAEKIKALKYHLESECKRVQKLTRRLSLKAKHIARIRGEIFDTNKMHSGDLPPSYPSLKKQAEETYHERSKKWVKEEDRCREKRSWTPDSERD